MPFRKDWRHLVMDGGTPSRRLNETAVLATLRDRLNPIMLTKLAAMRAAPHPALIVAIEYPGVLILWIERLSWDQGVSVAHERGWLAEGACCGFR